MLNNQPSHWSKFFKPVFHWSKLSRLLPIGWYWWLESTWTQNESESGTSQQAGIRYNNPTPGRFFILALTDTFFIYFFYLAVRYMQRIFVIGQKYVMWPVWHWILLVQHKLKLSMIDPFILFSSVCIVSVHSCCYRPIMNYFLFLFFIFQRIKLWKHG